MLYRLKSDLNSDPDHHFGEPVTIVRRALHHLETTSRHVRVELYSHDDGRSVLDQINRELTRLARRSPGHVTVYEGIILEIHGSATPMGRAAQSITPDEAIHDEARG